VVRDPVVQILLEAAQRGRALRLAREEAQRTAAQAGGISTEIEPPAAGQSGSDEVQQAQLDRGRSA
jgi:hypothetical protein